MEIDPRLLVAAAIIGTVVLWAAAIILGRVDGRVTARGFRNGSIVAVAIFLATTLVAAIFLNGREFMFTTLDLPGALVFGAFVGLVLGLAYLWLGALLIAIGLLFRAKAAWTTIGAWVAVPIVVVSAGFGYVSFRSVQQDGSQPPRYAGSVTVQLTGPKLGSVQASGDAICRTDSAGNLRVDAGVGSTNFATRDGRPVTIQFNLDANLEQPSIAIAVGQTQTTPGKGWEPGPETMILSTGANATGGYATLAGLVPLSEAGDPDPTDPWSGSFSWTCSAAPLTS